MSTVSATLCRYCGRPIGSRFAIWIGDTPYHMECTWGPSQQPASAPSQRIPSFNETLGVDPTSKLAAAIDRLAAALEKYNSRNAPLPYSSDEGNPK